MEFTDAYLKRLCEKRYNQFVRGSLIAVLFLNAVVIFLIPSRTILDIMGWYGAGLLVFDLLLVLIYVKVSLVKVKIKDYLGVMIESRVYKNRGSNYNKEKITFYNSELNRIQNSLA